MELKRRLGVFRRMIRKSDFFSPASEKFEKVEIIRSPERSTFSHRSRRELIWHEIFSVCAERDIKRFYALSFFITRNADGSKFHIRAIKMAKTAHSLTRRNSGSPFWFRSAGWSCALSEILRHTSFLITYSRFSTGAKFAAAPVNCARIRSTPQKPVSWVENKITFCFCMYSELTFFIISL